MTNHQPVREANRMTTKILVWKDRSSKRFEYFMKLKTVQERNNYLLSGNIEVRELLDIKDNSIRFYPVLNGICCVLSTDEFKGHLTQYSAMKYGEKIRKIINSQTPDNGKSH